MYVFKSIATLICPVLIKFKQISIVWRHWQTITLSAFVMSMLIKSPKSSQRSPNSTENKKGSQMASTSQSPVIHPGWSHISCLEKKGCEDAKRCWSPVDFSGEIRKLAILDSHFHLWIRVEKTPQLHLNLFWSTSGLMCSRFSAFRVIFYLYPFLYVLQLPLKYFF